ncbi:MAG: hypothetical protein WBZ11_21035, partial [Candidatus Sulfotelmatobacter sp.]
VRKPQVPPLRYGRDDNSIAQLALSCEVTDFKRSCHPVDKPKGVVKGVEMRRVAVSNSFAMSLETWRHASPLRESFSVEKDLPPAIDTDERSVHD